MSHSAEKFRRGILLCRVSEKLRLRKSLWIRGGGFQDFLSKFFSLTEPENSVGGGEFFSVSLISGIEKLWTRGGGEYQDFQSEIFCLTVPKISVGESFGVAIFLGVEKVWKRGGGEHQVFPSKLFCLTVPKI